MPKFPTFPILFDECFDLSIGFLNKHGYLVDGKNQSGTVTWSRNGVKRASISLQGIIDDNPRIILNYSCDGKPVKNTIDLTSLPSNLGKGKVWYFICSHTGKRCRKLHLIDGHFIHRSALPSGMYECQTQTKKWREMEKVYGCYFDSDKCYTQLYKKHFKKFYNGKPTKKYLKLMRQIKKVESVSHKDIESLLILGC
ncbi:MAG: hypothetical protein WBG90_18300 [Saonia sp.]